MIVVDGSDNVNDPDIDVSIIDFNQDFIRNYGFGNQPGRYPGGLASQIPFKIGGLYLNTVNYSELTIDVSLFDQL